MSQDPIEYLASRNSEQLAIKALAKIFQNTTNCYKILLFKALLDSLGSPKAGNVSISFSSIAESMIFHAWYPLKYFRLSLGRQDGLVKIIDDISSSLREEASRINKQQLRLHIAQHLTEAHKVELLRYVPFRLLTPFFSEQLKGLPDHYKNRVIEELTEESFCSETPSLYMVSQSSDEVTIHSKWVRFLNENFLIFDGWCNFHWANFLQSRNPSVPAVIHKLAKPERRSSLNTQRKIWSSYLKRNAIECVYTSEAIEADNFSLDHVIPWSFVCHDYLWNLIPTSQSTNSSKGVVLPSVKELAIITEVQFNFLNDMQHSQSERYRSRVFDEFINELKLDERELLKWPRFKESYERSLFSLRDIAQHNGF